MPKLQAQVGDTVLWLNTLHGVNQVERGEVIITQQGKRRNLYSVVWAEGHHSRNDDFDDGCLLAVADTLKGKFVLMDPYSGHFRVTKAGEQHLVQQKLMEES